MANYKPLREEMSSVFQFLGNAVKYIGGRAKRGKFGEQNSSKQVKM